MEADIQQTLEAYLRGDVTLRDFRLWLLDRTADNPEAPRVAHTIEYLIDEAASGTYSRDELDAELRAIARERAAELV